MPSHARSPLERLRTYLNAVDLTCEECGHRDETGDWTATTTGSRVEYTHSCPSCGADRTRTVALESGEQP